MKIVGLFAGIGGLELGLSRGIGQECEPVLLSESWAPAIRVLEHNFPDVDINFDVRELKSLPSDVDLVTAGFPCTDLSQAGRMGGIQGNSSGLVSHLFGLLRRRRSIGRALPDILIENVPNMLVLDRGKAILYLVEQLEDLGYSWSYRTVDSRFTGVPQRRRRVVLFASTAKDPRPILLDQDAGGPREDSFRKDAFGFYWTEGARGLGWAADAVPPLKGGSSIGIPSQPGVWFPEEGSTGSFVKPSIEAGEMLQGFPRGWTEVGGEGAPGRALGNRWKMVGNAVTVGVAEWVGSQILAAHQDCAISSHPFRERRGWPGAAFGGHGVRREVDVSEFPVHVEYQHLSDLMDAGLREPLSDRAMGGFSRRLLASNLAQGTAFRNAIATRLAEMSPLDLTNSQ